MQSSVVCQHFGGSPAEKQQLEQFCSIWSGHFWTFAEVQLSLKIPGTLLLYCTVNEIWQGLLLARDLGSSAELYYIYVTDAVRGQGLGAQLMRAFEEFLLSHGQAEEIFLEVRPSNGEAIRLYERCGFRAAGRRKNYYQNGEDALIFTRLLVRA